MDQYIKEFLDYLRHAHNFSAQTIKSYGSDLRQFEKFLLKINACVDLQTEQTPIDIQEIDQVTIQTFLGHLYNQKRKKRSIARKIAALKSFFKFLRKQNVIVVSPMQRITAP
jgi:integrase/recombinase XerC